MPVLADEGPTLTPLRGVVDGSFDSRPISPGLTVGVWDRETGGG